MEEPWTICQGSGSESLFCHYPNDLGNQGEVCVGGGSSSR